MLYCYFGTDTEKVREAARAHAGEFDGDVVRIGAADWYEGLCTECAGSSSLFGGERLYIIDSPEEQADFRTEVQDALADFAESPNTFLLIEGGLTAPQKKKREKHAEKVHESKKEKKEFNTFALADSLCARNRKRLWMQLMDARSEGVSAEALIGIFMWQLKLLKLAARTSGASEAGASSFPYNKAKKALGNFAKGEVSQLARDLLVVYHDGHTGAADIDAALEAWVLKI